MARRDFDPGLFDDYGKLNDRDAREDARIYNTGDKLTNVQGKLVRRAESGKAVLLRLDSNGKEVWFPLSVIPILRVAADKTLEVCQVETWFLRNKGLSALADGKFNGKGKEPCKK